MDILKLWPLVLVVLEICVYFILGLSLILLHEFPRENLEGEEKEVNTYAAKVTERPQVLRRETWVAWSGAIHPGWLLGVRIVAFLYLSGLLIYVYNTREDWLHVFYYYTEWSLGLLIVYFGCGTFVSIYEYERNVKKHRESRHDPESGDIQASLLNEEPAWKHAGRDSDIYSSTELPEEKAGHLGYTLQILFQIVAPAVVLTDGVYWTFLFPFFPEDFPHTFSELNLHGINAVFLTAEILLNSMRFPWFRAAYFFVWSCLYVFFQWYIRAFHVIDAPWPYPFMEVSTAYAPFWYLSIGILHVSAYGIVAFLNRLKLILQGNAAISSRARWWSLARSFLPGGLT